MGDITRESAEVAIRELSAFKGVPVALDIFSNGGDAMGSLALASFIDEPANQLDVEVRVYGNAASGAMIISAAAKRAFISESAFALVHFAYAPGVDDANLSEEDKTVLASINDTQVKLFAKRSGKSPGEVKKLMSGDRQITAQAAVAFGLFDGLFPMAKMAALFNDKKMSDKPKTRTIKVTGGAALAAVVSGTIDVPEDQFTVSDADKVSGLDKQIADLTKERDDLKAKAETADAAKTTAEAAAKIETDAKVKVETELKAATDEVAKYKATIETLSKNPLVAKALADGAGGAVIPGADPNKKNANKSAEDLRLEGVSSTWEAAKKQYMQPA